MTLRHSEPQASNLGLRTLRSLASLGMTGSHRTSRALQVIAAVTCTLLTSAALAHAASTAYLDIGSPRANEVALQWVVPLRDLDAVIDLDANADGQLTWSEVVARESALDALMQEQLRFSTGNGAACPLDIAPIGFTQLDGSGYAALHARAVCAAAIDRVELDYRFLQRVDATHRVLVTIPGQQTPRPLAPGQQVALDLNASTSGGTAHDAGFRALLENGVAHILGGIDHLLFLVALLLPAVVTRTAGRWVARPTLKPALLEVACIATAFTVAHSITLALASFHVVSIPGRVIEPLIAGTVLLAALNNLRPIVTRRLAAVAFCFGLIHGFGFAEVLAPLALPTRELAIALLGFNLGVEAGQLAVVCAAFALLALARRWQGYGRWVLGGGSAALALIAGVWITERLFDLPLFALALAAAS